ncbi:cation:proton antiporter [Croceibacterium sp. TMG7-5b_MA50]|uniref:cation:proton antiporter n=1 Tax=Croceibacterium sp. TMG7-5b_MA50 TaxID=3121290 RepID=UPI00322209D0
MPDQPFYGLSSYHTTLMALGMGIILAYWLPRFVTGREPAASALLIGIGAIAFHLIPDLPGALDPREQSRFWEVLSEIAVIVALFGTGLRIDNLHSLTRWTPTIRLLALAMPLTIGAVALLGWAWGGMTAAGAILLGAVLAPTDPVLAGDVQVGPPTEGGEHPVRFALTTEAGLNDGLSFPFVYLALFVGMAAFSFPDLLVEWFLLDVLYRIAIGTLAGAAIGWVLGRVLFVIPRGNVLADTGSGLLALAGVLLCYGTTELIEGYGFISCFVAGLVLRRVEEKHTFHTKLHSFNEAIELSLTAILLVLVGGVLPLLWEDLTWTLMGIALALLLVIRPLAGWLSLARTELRPRERAVVAFYGVRGIGSVYYLGFATHHMELVNEGELWATIAFTILLSTIIHGLTAGIAVDRVAKPRPDGDGHGNAVVDDQ